MRPAVLLCVLLSVTGAAALAAEPARDPSRDYVSVSRAMTEIDAAERQGELADELRWAKSAESAPLDAAAQFLAVAAQPGIENRWAGYRDLSLQFPRSALPWVGMARTYLAWRTWDQVERAIKTALQRDPGCWLAVRIRADMAVVRNKPEAAQADYQEVLKADPKNPEAHFGLARLARARGDLDGAHAHAAAALEEARTLPGAWAILAQISQDIGEPGAAIDFWNGAVEQAPRDRVARVTLARLLTSQGQHAAAVEQWKAAVDIKEDPESLAALADAARAAGDGETERSALERMARLKPDADQWRRVADARLAAADLSEAELAYRKALEARPRDEQANLGMGRVQLARGKSVEAVESLRAAGAAGQADLAALEARLNLQKIGRNDVNALQRAVQAQVDRTYRARLAQTPSLSGKLRLRVTVDGSGAASLVEVLEDSVHDDDVRACAYWNLRDASYPPEHAGRYSFAFTFGK
jgi:tetratricopeptide (TPR) repeat protein